MKIRILTYFIILTLSFASGLYSQSVINGSVKVYNSEFTSWMIHIYLLDSNDKIIAETEVDSLEKFYFNSIPNGKINLSLDFPDFFTTEIKNIVLQNDTIQFKNIPMFVAENFEWEYPQETEIYRALNNCRSENKVINSSFPANNKIYMECNTAKNDSFLFELDPINGEVEIEFEKFEVCSSFLIRSHKK